VLDRNLGDRLQIRRGQNTASGVLWGIEDDEARTVCDEIPQLIDI
jgi:hypothetical protein